MDSAAAIRSLPAVAAFQDGNLFEAYGLARTDVEALAAARAAVDTYVDRLDAAVTAHFSAMKESGQNPYLPSVELVDEKFRFATLVELPAPHDLYSVPDATGSVLFKRAIELFGERLRTHGFELAKAGETRYGRTCAVIRDRVYVEEATKQALAADDGLRLVGDVGIRGPVNAEQMRAVRQIASDFCTTAMEHIAVQLRGMYAGGGTPFGHADYELPSEHLTVVDNTKVKRGKRDFVPGGLPVVVARLADLWRATDAHTSVDHTVFLAFLGANLAERLRQRPDLKAAAIATTGIGYHLQDVVVVCAEDRSGSAPRAMLPQTTSSQVEVATTSVTTPPSQPLVTTPQPVPTRWYDRLLALVGLQRRAIAASPQLLALPAPAERQVVGPVTTGPYAIRQK